MNNIRYSIIEKISFHLLLIAIIGLAAYSNTFDVPFQFDDFNNIPDNPIIKDLGNFISSLSGYQYNPRRYIGYLTLALNYRFGGHDVTWYHAVNIAIHILNGLLVYFLVALTFRTPYFRGPGAGNQGLGTSNQVGPVPGTQYPVPDFIALFSALLFVSHPIQTQAVTYIVQRFTSLATMFYLLSVVMYIKGRQMQVEAEVKVEKDSNSAPRPLSSTSALTLTFYFLSLLCAVLAMKTKEIAFTLPITLLLYEFFFFRSALKKKLIFLIPILLTAAIIPISMMHTDRPLGEILSDLSEKTRVQTNISRLDYLMTEMRVIVTYIRLVFLPVSQNLDYDYPTYHSFLTPQVFLSFLFLLALFGTAMWLLYKSQRAERKEQSAASFSEIRTPCAMPYAFYRLIAFGILWFFITLSVESSIIPIADVIFEHRVYLPSVGFFIAVTAGVFLLVNRLVMALSPVRFFRGPMPYALCSLLFVLLILALASASYARNEVWRDGIALWEDVARKAPANARAQNNLGYVYNARGMTDKAMEHFISAVRMNPEYLDARINLGITYNAKGMTDAAIEQFTTVLRKNWDDADAHNNIGIAYVSKGMIDKAITHYLIALKLNPDYPEAYNNLGVAYGYKDMLDQAIPYLRNAIQLKPDYFEAHYNLALLFLKKNDTANAEEEYRRLAMINPEAAKKILDLIRGASR